MARFPTMANIVEQHDTTGKRSLLEEIVDSHYELRVTRRQVVQQERIIWAANRKLEEMNRELERAKEENIRMRQQLRDERGRSMEARKVAPLPPPPQQSRPVTPVHRPSFHQADRPLDFALMQVRSPPCSFSKAPITSSIDTPYSLYNDLLRARAKS